MSRWLSDCGSTPHPDRDSASAAGDVARVADELGIDQFAVMGHSGGGPHALACAALLPERVLGVVSMAALAPVDAEGLDWFAGMAASGAASLRAAVDGRAAKERHEASGDEYDPEFTPADLAARARSPARTGRPPPSGPCSGSLCRRSGSGAGMSDYSEQGAIPVEDAAVEDPPTVDEVLERQRAEHPDQAATSSQQPDGDSDPSDPGSTSRSADEAATLDAGGQLVDEPDGGAPGIEGPNSA